VNHCFVFVDILSDISDEQTQMRRTYLKFKTSKPDSVVDR